MTDHFYAHPPRDPEQRAIDRARRREAKRITVLVRLDPVDVIFLTAESNAHGSDPSTFVRKLVREARLAHQQAQATTPVESKDEVRTWL